VRPEEVRDVGVVAGEGFGGVVGGIGGTHGAIAERVFQAVGPAAGSVKLIHDQVAALAYGATSGVGRVALRAGALGASLARRVDAPSLDEAPAGRIAVGALSGMYGDRLAERSSPLAVQISLRCDGRVVEPSADSLADTYPSATPRLAIFLHGLCETEGAWSLHATRCKPYGARLREELGFTPLYIRYNSGLPISDNGALCSELIDAVVAAWPVEVAEIALIGHSMGGLVARYACHHGAKREWAARVRHVFTLGAPHRGAPLEQLVERASVALARLPETRALAAALDARSIGIKDLRSGRELPLLPTANHYFVSATLSPTHDTRLGRMIGDILVLHASAWDHEGAGERLPFPVDNYRHYGSANHFDLLNHPAIGDQIVRWIGTRALLNA
jgi:pimeloyl-ACP methyl ester carboxylesterase